MKAINRTAFKLLFYNKTIKLSDRHINRLDTLFFTIFTNSTIVEMYIVSIDLRVFREMPPADYQQMAKCQALTSSLKRCIPLRSESIIHPVVQFFAHTPKSGQSVHLS